MAFHYPNGQLFSQKNPRERSLQKETTFANRGMRFEEAINQSNEYYLTHDKAVVHKKPTPLQILRKPISDNLPQLIIMAFIKDTI